MGLFKRLLPKAQPAAPAQAAPQPAPPPPAPPPPFDPLVTAVSHELRDAGITVDQDDVERQTYRVSQGNGWATGLDAVTVRRIASAVQLGRQVTVIDGEPLLFDPTMSAWRNIKDRHAF